MILSYDVQNNLDVHSRCGMCQITHRRSFVLWQSFHFQGGLHLLSDLLCSLFPLILRLFDFRSVCMYLFFGCFVMAGGMKMKRSHFNPLFLLLKEWWPIRTWWRFWISSFDWLVCQNGEKNRHEINVFFIYSEK